MVPRQRFGVAVSGCSRTDAQYWHLTCTDRRLQQRDVEMAHVLKVGLALPNHDERATVSEWLTDADMRVETLVEACKVDSDVTGRGFACVVADGELLKSGYLGGAQKPGSRVPVVALVDASAATDPAFSRAGVSALVRPFDAKGLTLAVSLAHGDARPARAGARRRTPRVPSKVSDAPAIILDISRDGVRLELSRAHAAKLGPQFRFQVPMVALDVVLRRAWVASAPGGLVHCGATLVGATASQMLAWERILELSASTMSLPGMKRHDTMAGAFGSQPLLGRVSQLLSSASAVANWAGQLTRGGA